MGYKDDLNDFDHGMVIGVLNQMGHSTTATKLGPLLSDIRVQFALVDQNWTIEVWKTIAWSDESGFLLRHSD